MADEDRLSSSLQESILTLIAFDDVQGKIVTNLVTPDLFEPPYRDIATRVLDFRKKNGKAPGESHVDDLFDHVLEDPKNRQANVYRRLLIGMIEQSKGLNAVYVASRVTDFIRRQTLKGAVIRAANRYQQGGDEVTVDVELILGDALKQRVESFDPGIFLSDSQHALGFLDHQMPEYRLGVREFDNLGFGLSRGSLMMILGTKGSGKSWGLVHIGKQALLQRAKVCHITLENSVDQTLQRYYQSMFAIAKRNDLYTRTQLETDKLGHLVGLNVEKLRPKLNLRSKKIRQELLTRIENWGTRFGRLVVKRFPAGMLTVNMLRAYLDEMETTFNFVPDVLILDYPQLMHIPDAKLLRQTLGRIVIDIRGLCTERNMAGAIVAQGNRDGMSAKTLQGKHTGEDISMIQTCDDVLTYSQTSDEKKLGLARLFVEKCRSDKDGYTVLVSQSYTTGQWALGSTLMEDRKYWPLFEEVTGTKKPSAADEDDEDDE